jgi:hypothetical protein
MQEEGIMKLQGLQPGRLASAAVGFLALALAQAVAQSPDQAALSAALKDTNVTLEQGLRASEQKGKPMSAKFELDDNKKLQISVYTMAGDGFTEVVVDPGTGTVRSAEKIAHSEDRKAAAAQSAAMDKARVTLITAIESAAKENAGARVVSIFPEIRDGQPVADVTLMRGDSLAKVTEKLN